MCNGLFWSVGGTLESAVGSDGTLLGTFGIPQKCSAHGGDALEISKFNVDSDVALELLESECLVADEKPQSKIYYAATLIAPFFTRW